MLLGFLFGFLVGLMLVFSIPVGVWLFGIKDPVAGTVPGPVGWRISLIIGNVLGVVFIAAAAFIRVWIASGPPPQGFGWALPWGVPPVLLSA